MNKIIKILTINSILALSIIIFSSCDEELIIRYNCIDDAESNSAVDICMARSDCCELPECKNFGFCIDPGGIGINECDVSNPEIIPDPEKVFLNIISPQDGTVTDNVDSITMVIGDGCKFENTVDSVPTGDNKIVVYATVPDGFRVISQIYVTQPDDFVVLFVDDPIENTNEGVCTPVCGPEPCCSSLINYTGLAQYFNLSGVYKIEAIIVGDDGTELAYDSINVFIE